jgi:hypothetical protein
MSSTDDYRNYQSDDAHPAQPIRVGGTIVYADCFGDASIDICFAGLPHGLSSA